MVMSAFHHPKPWYPDWEKPSIVVVQAVRLYVTSIRLRISRSTAIDSFASTFHPFATCVGHHLIYKPFRNECCRFRGNVERFPPHPKFTLIERIVWTLKVVCKGIVYPAKPTPDRVHLTLRYDLRLEETEMACRVRESECRVPLVFFTPCLNKRECNF